MKRLLFILTLALPLLVFADIFDVFEADASYRHLLPFDSFKAFRNLPHDVQTIIAQQMIGNKIMTPSLVKTLHGHRAGVKFVAWSPDGKQLASASKDMTIQIWDAQTGQNTQTLQGHASSVLCVRWNPSGTQLASCSIDNTIKIWDTQSWQNIQTLTAHTGWVNSVAWSHNGTQLASASEDMTIKIWDTQSWQDTQTLQEHNDAIDSVAWSNDDTRLASSSSDGTIKIWDTHTWQDTHTLNATSLFCAWSHDDTRLASVADTIPCIWNTANWQGVVFAQTPASIGTIQYAESVAWSPDDAQLAAGLNNDIVLWNTAGWRISRILPGHTQVIASVAWSPDGKHLASASDDRTIKIWSFPRPIIQGDELHNISLEQALFLTLLHTQRPTYAHARHKPILLATLHAKLNEDEALRLLNSFDDDTKLLLKQRFNIQEPAALQEPQKPRLRQRSLSPDEPRRKGALMHRVSSLDTTGAAARAAMDE